MEHTVQDNLGALLKEFKKKKMITSKLVRARIGYKKPSELRKEALNKAIRTQRYKVLHGMV